MYISIFHSHPYLKQHDIIVKRPVLVLVVPDHRGDVEPLLKALLLHDAVVAQDHLDHAGPKTAQ